MACIEGLVLSVPIFKASLGSVNIQFLLLWQDALSLVSWVGASCFHRISMRFSLHATSKPGGKWL
jgi:hypothetical protein